MNDTEITTLMTTLSRPHRSGGVVIERAAILAAGADYATIVDWIVAHSGAPEASAPTPRSRGIHGSRFNDASASTSRPPMRFVLPPGALD